MRSTTANPCCLIWAITTVLLMEFASANEGEDPPIPLSGSITIASDYVFRGISQTLGKPAFQASLDLQLDSGFYAYAWASNVDFFPASEPDDGARTEINVAAGYVFDIGDRWTVDVSLVRYFFPGTSANTDYDYSELISVIGFDEKLCATVGYSNSVDGTKADSWYTELGYAVALPAEVTFDVAYGYYDLSRAYGSAYEYASAAVSKTLAGADVSLSYYDAFGGADEVFFTQSHDSRFVLSVLVDF